MTPDEYCQDKAARSGSSFYYSFLFLPADQRRAITALYAFCREVDDVVDECSDTAVARVKLQWWSEELERLYAGHPRHPVGHALVPVVNRYALARDHFQAIIDGMAMDLDGSRYASFQDLDLYCYRVAGVVGLMAAEIFGYDNGRTLKYAHHLGTAFQLTNILRDVREDAGRGRIYLPLDELERFGVAPRLLTQGQTTDSIRALFAFQAQRAREYYTKAFSLLPEEDRFRQRSGIIMARIYQATLAAMEEDGFGLLERRVSLTPLRKLWIAWRTARGETRRHRANRRRA